MMRAIFFDIDNTLFSTRDFARRARSASVEAMIQAGLRIDAPTLMQELDEVVREFSSNYEKHFDKLLLRLPRRVTRGLNPSLIVAAGMVAYHQTKFRHLEPFEDAYEVLRRLALTDLVRGVITEGLEVRLVPKLYQRACGDLNLRPSECMYVGDQPLLDIDPANAIGMVTVRILREGHNRDLRGETEPDHEVENFWDLAEIIKTRYEVAIPEVI